MSSDRPGELSSPSGRFAEFDLPIVEVASPWFRCHRRGRGPVHFGRAGTGRFDDPSKKFGVLYLGVSARAAFVEVLGQELGLASEDLRARVMSTLVAAAPARLVDLTGAHLPRLGLDARVFAASHAAAQRWSQAFHVHPSQPDGLLYRCRHDPSELAVALFDRREWAFDASELPEATLAALAGHYGLAVE